MDFDRAREVILQLLRSKGKSKNSEMLDALGGDSGLLAQVREDLLFNDLAEDKKGVGLIYTGPPEQAPLPDGPSHAAPATPQVRQGTAAGGPPTRGQVFISYGRRDAEKLANRLAVDLAAHGYRVWQDKQQIRARHPWHREIEDGLRSSQIVIALLSPHAVRRQDAPESAESDSVCLDEISYAQYELHLPVVPVMAVPCSPPLFIHRLDYVDLHQWCDSEDQYQTGLRRLLAALDEAAQGRVRYRTWADDLRPFDFAPLMHVKRKGFVGREWLFDEIDAWRAASDERALLIKGDPGIGKSAIVAELVCRNRGGQVLAYHFCQADTPETLRPARFVRSMAAMIASQIDLYAASLEEPKVKEALEMGFCERDPGSALEEGVLAPLQKLSAPEEGVRYVLIDALDEALTQPREPGQKTIVDVLASRLERLPPWMRIVATTRNERPVLDRLCGLRAQEIDARDPRNLDDIDRYIAARLDTPNLAEQMAGAQLRREQVAAVLREKCDGNFLYIQQALEGVERGQYRLDRLEALPPGLYGLYQGFFERHFVDEARYAGARSALEVVVAACESLTEEQLAAATGLDRRRQLPAVLRTLSAYVPQREHEDGRARYAVYHKSLADWLTHPDLRGTLHAISAEDGHGRLAVLCWNEYQGGPRSMSPYARAHLPEHLIAAARWDDLERLLTDLLYLEARTVAGQGFALVEDFSNTMKALPEDRPQHRILRLLTKALMNSIHFIAAHAQDYPQGLFQCLWNSCWWYDCPEAANHCDVPRDGWPQGGPPWDHTGPKLFELLERWRVRKEECSPRFLWIRALRPSPPHLDVNYHLRGHRARALSVGMHDDGEWIVTTSYDGRVLVWSGRTCQAVSSCGGHESFVTSLAYSSDGCRIAAGSLEGTVRVWDTRSGVELRCLRGHDDGVLAVSYSPDDRAIVTGALDKTVRIWDAETGREVLCIRGHRGFVESASYSPDGRRIVTGSADKTVRVWDAETGAELQSFPHVECVCAVWYSDDGTRLNSETRDGREWFWHPNRREWLSVAEDVEDRSCAIPGTWAGRERGIEILPSWLGESGAFFDRRLTYITTVSSGSHISLVGTYGDDLCFIALEGGSGEPKNGRRSMIRSKNPAVGIGVQRYPGEHEYCHVLLPRESLAGKWVTKTFEATQDTLTLTLYKGDSQWIEECELLTVLIIRLVHGRPSPSRFELRLGYDDAGTLRAEVVDPWAKRVARIVIASANAGLNRPSLKAVRCTEIDLS